MVKLYTAVGRYEVKTDENGLKRPMVTVNMKEAELQVEEMLLWSCLMWNIATSAEAYNLFKKKAEKVGIDPDRFHAVLERLQVRHLVVSAEAERGDEALYKLLSNLYVIPMTSSFGVKVRAFFKLVFKKHVPVSVAKIVFQKDDFTEMEKKVLHLAKQTHLSCAEILKCIEENVTDLSTSEKVLTALYDDDYSTCDNLGWFMRFYNDHKSILEAISTLYLKRNVIFDKWY